VVFSCITTWMAACILRHWLGKLKNIIGEG
jgi:hypothetical protein